MVFEQIEALKRQYTDKYVVVDETRPELRRFQGQTGTVRTVNMSGKALVEFDAHENIGWFDIDPDFLRIIEEPLPKPEKAERGKPATEKKPAADKSAAAKPSAKKPATGMSVEEMLAAARGEKKGGAPASAAKAKPAASAKKMTVEEMLAAARAEKAGGAAPAPQAAASVETPVAPAEEPSAAAAAPAAEEPVAEESSTPSPKAAADLPTTTDGIVAYCRQVDG